MNRWKKIEYKINLMGDRKYLKNQQHHRWRKMYFEIHHNILLLKHIHLDNYHILIDVDLYQYQRLAKVLVKDLIHLYHEDHQFLHSLQKSHLTGRCLLKLVENLLQRLWCKHYWDKNKEAH